jgi:hydrogenase/urease accessory protein HupE
MKMSSKPILVFLVLSITLFISPEAKAHDPGLSAAELQLSYGSLAADLSFAFADIEQLLAIDADHNQQISQAEFLMAQAQLEQLARGALAITVDRKPLLCEAATVMLDSENGVLRFKLKFSGVVGEHLELESFLIKSLARGHRQYLVLRDEAGNVLVEQMLQATNAKCDIDLQQQANSKLNAFTKFVVLGIEHILTGYDHLAFLFALLLAGSTLREVLKIITSFTLAHSISLALATFNVVTISPAIVEPLIAVSIVYVGCENLFRRNLNRRWLLTFGFGLIHGLGFASVLRELNIGNAARVAIIPLLSFNLGVELGQVTIAALVLPLIWRLKPRSWFVPRLVPLCSTCVALLGVFWLIMRVFPR